MRRLPSRLSIVNVVATAELRQSLDLTKLAFAKGFLYDAAVYRCAYLKDEKMIGKVSVFSTGKMISVGARSLQAARRDLSYTTRRLEEMGLITHPRIEVKLQNIVATGELGRHINIESLASKLPQVIYEPEQFPAAIHYAKELEGASILIFASGKVVFSGLKTQRLLRVARHVLAELAQKSSTGRV